MNQSSTIPLDAARARLEFFRLTEKEGSAHKIARQVCPFCKRRAVVALAPDQLADQPDDTTHVCHPMLRGCNHGFAVNP